MTGVYVVIQPSGLPVLIALALLVAASLPLREASGGVVRRVAAGIGLGVLRSALAVLVALGLYVACLVSGALLQAHVTASAAAAAAPTEREIQRGPERGA